MVIGAVSVRRERTACSAFISWLTPMTTFTGRMAGTLGHVPSTSSVTSPAASNMIDRGSVS